MDNYSISGYSSVRYIDQLNSLNVKTNTNSSDTEKKSSQPIDTFLKSDGVSSAALAYSRDTAGAWMGSDGIEGFLSSTFLGALQSASTDVEENDLNNLLIEDDMDTVIESPEAPSIEYQDITSLDGVIGAMPGLSGNPTDPDETPQAGTPGFSKSDKAIE